ncbi:MAG: MXAN_2562 family outer membrane beta-barrel protein, partial [Myxococcota bacterium]|nr:MXAN_2562 family outer membrane beta-barrel protein [Myxococcota bacterium]
SASFRLSALELFSSEELCIPGQNDTVRFFLLYRSPDLTGTLYQQSEPLELPIDLVPPSAPSKAPTVVPAEEALEVSFSTSDEAESHEVCARPFSGESADEETPAGEDAGVGEEEEPLTTDRARGDYKSNQCRAVSSGSNSLRFDDLRNDTTYEVIYARIDSAGNRSANSPVALGSPAEVKDFAEAYGDNAYGGGLERGGCQSTSGEPTLVLLLIFFALALGRRSRTHWSLVLSLFVLSSAVSAPAEARPMGNSGDSDRSATIELRFGAYIPQIDSEFAKEPGVPTPYEAVFKNDDPMMSVFGAERHLHQRYGTLSIGFAVGRWSVEGVGLSEAPGVKDTTELTITPFSAHVGYRFDRYQESFPLIPMARLGLSYYLWEIFDGAGETTRFPSGEEASGGTLGWNMSIGAYLLLDYFDQEMAWFFDRDAGVNNSYLTIEYQIARVDDFGAADSFRLGNDTLFFGLALDI